MYVKLVAKKYELSCFNLIIYYYKVVLVEQNSTKIKMLITQ